MLPEKFLERMQRLLGEEYGAFMESLGGERYQGLRLNPLKQGVNERSGEEAVKRCFAPLKEVPWAEGGYYYQAGDRPGKHPYHNAGLYYIQEPSAMAPAELLGVRPGERVLDLCAAPGGKSTQIAAKLGGSGLLVSNEIHLARARILSENIERLGITNACVTNEPPERLADFFAGFFDRILVDAPCSGEGMFRKNQEACQEWSPENVELCARRQDSILDCAAGMLRPGGRLVYSTCTFASQENEGSVGRFLERHGEFGILPLSAEKLRLGLAGCDGLADAVPGSCPGPEETLRLWPHRVKGEGHFAAVLEKKGGMGGGYRGGASNGTAGGLPEADFKDFDIKDFDIKNFDMFCRRELLLPKGGLRELGFAVGMAGDARYIRFGDNLYLVPRDMPSLRGLKVIRPGLHIGVMKKNRFEPSHALALALKPDFAAHVWELSCECRTLGEYLGGGTFPAEGEKGWYLVCADGFGIGWGKLAGGMMKNHYPRGLRMNDICGGAE